MNKTNLIRVFIFLPVFFILITPLAYPKLEEGAGTVIGGSLPSDTDTSISPETTGPSPADITNPSTETWTEDDEDFYDNVMGLSSEEQSKLTEEEINKFRNIPFRNVGDEDNPVRISFNKETGDGNIGATDSEFEIKGYDQLCQFKTLTSKSGKVIFFGNSASDIESISIKDGEVININFKNKDSENEVLIAQAIGEGIWSSFSKEEQKEEGGSISFEEQDFITVDKGISFRVGDNKVTVGASETKIKIEPLEDSDSYYNKGVYIGASFYVEQGKIYVEGETSKLKISYAPSETEEEQETIKLNTKSLFSEDQKEFSILKETEKPPEKTEIIFGFDGSKYIFLQDFEKDQINFFEVPWIESVNGEQEPAKQEETETNIQILQTEKETQLLLKSENQEKLETFQKYNRDLIEQINRLEYYKIYDEQLSEIGMSENNERRSYVNTLITEVESQLETNKDKYMEYLKLKDGEADIDKSLEEIETKLDELKDSTTSESTVEVKPPEDLDKTILPITQQLPSELLSENTQKEKAIGINVKDKTLYDIIKEKEENLNLMSENLILGWIDQESSMNQDAELGGCVGFTQASAISFRDVINRNPEKYKKYISYTNEELTKALKDDALLNLEVGFDYMNSLKTTYGFSQEKVESNYQYTGDEEDIMLMAYNAGPTVTKNILTEFKNNGGGNWDELEAFLHTDEALNIFKKYKKSYGVKYTDTEEEINSKLRKKINIVIKYVKNIKRSAGYA